MSTNFPSALDTFTNPNGSDSLNAAAVPHAEQHANANDAIEALQAKVGVNGSAVATSLDYRISAAETGLGGKISSTEKGSENGVATLGFDGKVPSSQLPPLDYIPTSEKGVSGGVAGLDEAGKVPAAQLPSYVDDVLEYTNLAAFPVTGEAGKIHVALDTNKTYRWSGSTYIYITSGAVDSVAGKTGVVTLVKGDVGLGNVDNTSDANKPVSTATQTALNAKQATLVSGTNIKTINGSSLLGSGNLEILSTLPVVEVSTTTQAMQANTHYVVTTAGAAAALTMPPSPTVGDLVQISVANGRTDNSVVANVSPIQGQANDLFLDLKIPTYEFKYLDSTRGWYL